jgi:hypothetical protein
MEIPHRIAWSNQLEEYFAETGERCQGYAFLHKRAEAKFSYRRSCIDLPVIVLSTVAGTLSIGSSGIFGDDKYASMGIGCLSLLVGVLNTISTYFAFSKRAEGHRLCSIEYSKLFRFLSVELSLPVCERMNCGDLLKVVKEQYERLQEIAPLIPDDILLDFKTRFKEYKDKIAFPQETNGLEEVEIFREGRKQSYSKLRSQPLSPERFLDPKTPRPSSIESLGIRIPETDEEGNNV